MQIEKLPMHKKTQLKTKNRVFFFVGFCCSENNKDCDGVNIILQCVIKVTFFLTR